MHKGAAHGVVGTLKGRVWEMRGRVDVGSLRVGRVWEVYVTAGCGKCMRRSGDRKFIGGQVEGSVWKGGFGKWMQR